MRRCLMMLAVFALCYLTTTARSAHAGQGMNLRWDACMGNGGTLNKNFACNTNTGSEQLFVSFELSGAQFGPVNGLEFGLDVVASNSAALPTWWMFRNVGSCRQFALTQSAGMLTPDGNCIDFWQGMASGGITSYFTSFSSSPDRAHLTGIYAVAPADMATLQPNTEYFGARLSISRQKTVGTGACAGCSTPMCLGLSHVKLTRPVGTGDLLLLDETSPRSSIVSWQSGPVSSEIAISHTGPPAFRIVSCSVATPARNHTWGAIKSLYR